MRAMRKTVGLLGLNCILANEYRAFVMVPFFVVCALCRHGAVAVGAGLMR